jgi:hypothetical protein
MGVMEPVRRIELLEEVILVSDKRGNDVLRSDFLKKCKTPTAASRPLRQSLDSELHFLEK